MPASAQTMTYDADGNLTSDGVWSYTCDAENRLIEMTMSSFGNLALSNQLRLDFAYDYMNRRISKIVSTNSGLGFVDQSTNYFIYDGWNLIAIFDPSSEVRQSFVWGNDLSRTMTNAGGIGGLLMVNIGGTNSFASYDGNGNVLALINASNSTVCARYEYSSFGETIRITGLFAGLNPFRFSTKFTEGEDGLIYFGRRYYNPAIGRWLSKDPKTEQGELNVFAYVANGPIMKADALGLEGLADFISDMFDRIMAFSDMSDPIKDLEDAPYIGGKLLAVKLGERAIPGFETGAEVVSRPFAILFGEAATENGILTKFFEEGGRNLPIKINPDLPGVKVGEGVYLQEDFGGLY